MTQNARRMVRRRRGGRHTERPKAAQRAEGERRAWSRLSRLFVLAVGFGALGAGSGAGGSAPFRLEIGKPVPGFRLRALDGAMVRLDELAYPGREKAYAKKRPVLLDFFRTDCEPCVKAVPELEALHERYTAEGLGVLVVALLEEQDGQKKLEDFLGKRKLPFKVVIDHSNHFAKQYLGTTVSLPATFLIDRGGTLVKAKYDAKGSYEEFFGGEIREVVRAGGAAPE